MVKYDALTHKKDIISYNILILAISALCYFIFGYTNTAFADILSDRIKPFISVREIYDSNVFRVKDKDSLRRIVGDDQLHDFITFISAGVNLNYELSRQKIELLLRKDFLYFSHYDDQNANQDTVNGNLYLRAYDKFSAKINGIYTKVLEPKEYYQTDKKIYRKNIGGGIELGYDMPLGLTIKAGFRQENVDFSIPELDIRERTMRLFTGGVSYRISPDSEFDLLYARDMLDYDKLESIGGRMVDNDSTGDTIKCVFQKKVSPITFISLSAGYHQRKYDEFDERDFHGFIGKADISYGITEKLTLLAGAERKLYEETFIDQIYSVNEIVGLGASYKATEKIKAYIYGSITKKSFKGHSNIIKTDLPERDDDIDEFRSGIEWSPIQRLFIDLLYRYQKWDSNYNFYNFEAHGVEIGLSYKF